MLAADVPPEELTLRSFEEDENVLDADTPETEKLPPVVFRLPNTAFGISLGLGGHAIVWKSISNTNFMQSRIEVRTAEILNKTCWYLTVIVSGVLMLMYLYKIATSFALVKAEWFNEVRCHFFNAPNLAFLILLMGIPDSINVADKTFRTCWGISFGFQVILTTCIYKAWMFSAQRNFSKSKPQFLMSTVGWLFLAAIGQKYQIKLYWGIGLPQMCFGAGFILYIDVMIFILSNLSTNQGMKGSPGMFLLIAPPSVAVVSLDSFNDGVLEFSETAEMLLGWVYILLILLICMGPRIWKAPSVLGEYWAYVFPVASATAATIRYATALETSATQAFAVIMILLSISTLLLVFGRMLYHIFKCISGKEQWEDPLFDRQKYRISGNQSSR